MANFIATCEAEQQELAAQVEFDTRASLAAAEKQESEMAELEALAAEMN